MDREGSGTPGGGPRLSAWRKAALTASLLGGAAVFAVSVTRHLPLEGWLFFRYTACWIQAGVLAAACVAAGHRILGALAPEGLELRERIVLAFSIGVVALTTVVFLGGIAGLLSRAFFVALPVATLALTGPRAARELVPELGTAYARARGGARPTAPRAIVTAVGVLGVLLVYVPILAPAHVSYDARWYHLAIAEHYAAAGAIGRFPEGLVAGTYPQAATLLYTWAFLSPLGGIESHVELAAHVEFVVFLMTLAGIPALVRRLAPQLDARGAWAGFVLFPGIFVYDSGLVCGADHVAALFAVPILLAAQRAWDGLDPRACALLAIFVSGALLTKYTAASLAVAPLFMVAARAVQLGAQRAWRGVAVFATVGLALTAQHWLRNWVFYGDPVYPVLAHAFHPRPWTPDSAEWFRTFRARAMIIPGTLQVRGPADLARTLVTFSLEPHDWPAYHGKVPVFGYLFTAATFALPFLRRTRPIWAVAGATYAGLAFWALLNAQDRYLQALLPWMIAVTVAVLALAVREGVAARVAVGLLVGLQLVWGGDACFLPSHGYRAPLAAAIERLGGSYAPGAPQRSEPFAPWPQIGRALPRGARVLIHEGDEHLGLGAPAVMDWLPFAYGIDYGACRSMREVHDLVRSMGITHVVWQLQSRGADSLAGDLLFYAYAQRHVTGRGAIGQYALGSVPETAPPATPLGKVVVLSCTGPYASGLYEVADVGIAPHPADDASRYPPPRVAWSTLGEEERVRALATAEFLVTEPGCAEMPAQGAAAFERLASRGPHRLYARR